MTGIGNDLQDWLGISAWSESLADPGQLANRDNPAQVSRSSNTMHSNASDENDAEKAFGSLPLAGPADVLQFWATMFELPMRLQLAWWSLHPFASMTGEDERDASHTEQTGPIQESATESAAAPEPPPVQHAAPVEEPLPSSVPVSSAHASIAAAMPQPANDVSEPAITAEQPELLDKPRGEPDDLKRIKGIGVKLEQLLHRNGVYHFHQIAAWTPAQIAWIDQQLSFRGRIEREAWISQAKFLADQAA